MRAAVMRNREIVVDTLPDPVPGSGEVLVKTLACGICGSDLHMLQHAEKMMESMRDTGAPFVPNLLADVVMGHEFCAEILDFGPNTLKRIPVGARVVSMPISFRGGKPNAVGYSDEVPGRLRRAHGADRAAAARSAERALDRSRRAPPSRWPWACTPSRRGR